MFTVTKIFFPLQGWGVGVSRAQVIALSVALRRAALELLLQCECTSKPSLVLPVLESPSKGLILAGIFVWLAGGPREQKTPGGK